MLILSGWFLCYFLKLPTVDEECPTVAADCRGIPLARLLKLLAPDVSCFFK